MAVGFNGVQGITASGNLYKKTNVAKIAGTAVGGAFGLADIVKTAKFLKKPSTVQGLKEMFGGNGTLIRHHIKTFEDAARSNAKICIAVGLGAGVALDLLVNAIKRHKADKAARAEKANI